MPFPSPCALFIPSLFFFALMSTVKYRDMCAHNAQCERIFIWNRIENNKDGHDHLGHSINTSSIKYEYEFQIDE